MKRSFPSDFVIGTASSCYQVEGAAFASGREMTIWDEFVCVPGAIYAGENGNVSIDQYHRYKEDVALMEHFGFQSYRFSLSWGRIIRSDFSINEEGIAHYRALAEELHKRGLTAVATLYHWDLPLYIQKNGGWENRDTAYLFASYASTCFELLGDVIDMWITLNEPWCSVYQGYYYGEHAPGRVKDINAIGSVAHHLNLAHGLAVKAYRSTKLKAPIGISWNTLSDKASGCVLDKEALETIQFDIDSGIFVYPVFKGYYPETLKKVGISLPIQEGDLKIISEKIDFYGINYYHEDLIERSDEFPFSKKAPMYYDITSMNWPIVPSGLKRLLEKMEAISGGVDVYVTGNGAAFDDVLTSDKHIHDKKRIEFLKAHLNACLDAISSGVHLKGYYLWTFIDNFEWAWGYSKRFGIIYTDYSTLERIPKDSAYYMMSINSERAID